MGAGGSHVLRMVMRQGLLLSAAGIGIGGAVSVLVARVLSAAMIGLGSPNPIVYLAAPAALVGLTTAASYFPARRASLVDPLLALRQD